MIENEQWDIEPSSFRTFTSLSRRHRNYNLNFSKNHRFLTKKINSPWRFEKLGFHRCIQGRTVITSIPKRLYRGLNGFYHRLVGQSMSKTNREVFVISQDQEIRRVTFRNVTHPQFYNLGSSLPTPLFLYLLSELLFHANHTNNNNNNQSTTKA